MFNMSKLIKRGLLPIAVVAALCAPASASAHILPWSAYAHTGSESANVAGATYSRPMSGFHWDDAFIGAAGILGLLGIAGVSSQQMRRRRQTLAS
jgi:hypothetical protein